MNDDLELLEKLCGVELRLFEKIPLDSYAPLIIESFRRMDDLYNEFCIARLNLIMAKKGTYPELIEQTQVDDNNKWMQYAFLNTSIVWYDNCFDILLQIIWVHFEIYKEVTTVISENPFEWNEEQINQIQSILTKIKSS